jgi:hypothetical protein
MYIEPACRLPGPQAEHDRSLEFNLAAIRQPQAAPRARPALTGPIPQVLAAAFDTGGSASSSAGLLLGRGAILLLAVATVAQYAIIVAETARLPMVAAWDHLLPAWFTRLHPRFRTPTRSLAVIVALAVLLCFLATAGSGNQEAFQVLVTCGNVGYAINYLLMFSVPLVAGTRFGARPGTAAARRLCRRHAGDAAIDPVRADPGGRSQEFGHVCAQERPAHPGGQPARRRALLARQSQQAPRAALKFTAAPAAIRCRTPRNARRLPAGARPS